MTAEKRQQIRDLAVDFPRLWQDPRTPDRERKRMARLLIEDVTLTKEEMYTVHVRFRGGALRTIRLPLLPNAPDAHRTPRQVIEEIDRLLDHHSEEEIAVLLNERGFRSGTGQLFDKHKVIIIRWTHKLKDRYTRLREAGFLTKEEIAERLGIRPDTVLKWRKQGLLQGIPYAQKGGREWLFPVPADDLPARAKHKRSWLERNSSR